MKIDAITAVVWAAAVTGFFTAITAIAVTWITKASDERRHLREICLRTAVENWKGIAQAAKDYGEGEIQPLDVSILHMLKFSELLDAKNLTPAQAAEKIREVGDVVLAATRAVREFTARASREE
jgi:Na+/phosphate symporter